MITVTWLILDTVTTCTLLEHSSTLDTVFSIYPLQDIVIHGYWYTDTIIACSWITATRIRYYTGYCYTNPLYTIISYSYPTSTQIHQFTEYRHFIYCSHRYMDARYTVISYLHITVTHACIVSIFLSYGSLFILHVLLLHVYSCIPVAWLFSVTDIPVTRYVSFWYAMCGTKCHVDPSHGSHL